ncbi:hypothetical protein D1007_11317 [Hordeum vulgare]|nr:hypothetical protein D1007_11317 [Hordeum vulgare]
MEDMASSVVISAMWCREVLLRWSSYFLLTFMVAVGGWMERFASSVGPRRIPASGVGGVVPVSGKSLARSTWNLIMGILRLVDDPMSLIDFLCAFQGAIQCWVSLYETEIMIAFIIHLYLSDHSTSFDNFFSSVLVTLFDPLVIAFIIHVYLVNYSISFNFFFHQYLSHCLTHLSYY